MNAVFATTFDDCGLCDASLTNELERDTGVCDQCAEK